MNRVFRSVVLLLLALGSGTCGAQPYPSKPIELVVHTTPGSGSDLIARTVAEIITREKFLPQPFVIQNRGGGGGAVAQTYVASKRGDPYVIMATTATVILSVPIRTGTDVGLDKFHPLGLIGIDLNSVGVREDSPYRTLKEFVAAGRANPKSINVAIGSVGGTGHHFVYQLERLTGARFNVVAMKTGTDALTAVLGGHVHAVADNLGELLPQTEAKKMRLLGVPAAKRLAGMPELPTMKEQGVDLLSGSARGFVAPAGIPREAATLLEDTLARTYKSAGWREYLAKNHYEDVYMNGEAFGRYLAARHTEMHAFLNDLGLVNRK